MGTHQEGQFCTVFELVAKIRRDLDIKSTDDFNFDNVIEWIAEAESEIGSSVSYIEKTQKLEIRNKTAEFPCDMHKMISIYFDNGSSRGSINFSNDKRFSNWSNSNNYNISPMPLPDNSLIGTTPNRFYINGNNINIEAEDGTTLNIRYYAIPTDENGFPLIKNTQYHKEAIFFYVLTKYKLKDVLNNKLNPNLYQNFVSTWHKKKLKARGEDNFPNVHELENIKRMYMRLIPDMKAYSDGFANLGNDDEYHRNP